jgi:hypothetical protein
MNRTRFGPLSALVAGALVLLGGVILLAKGSRDQSMLLNAPGRPPTGEMLLLHTYADLLIGFAYLSISITLVWIVCRIRSELPFRGLLALAFAAFIVTCGVTHFLEAWNLQTARPPHWLSGSMKFVTAAASVFAATLLAT